MQGFPRILPWSDVPLLRPARWLQVHAESLHISTNWFIRNFKQYMKISPAQYILSHQMVNAQSLLENTDYKIGEIAEIVGYDNQLYFSRVFRKEYGVSSAQYRKKMEKSSLSK